MAAWQGLFFIEWLPLGLAVGSVSAGAVGMTQPCVFHSLASLAGLEVRVREGKLLKCQGGTAQSAKPFTASTEFATFNIPLTMPCGQGQVQRMDELSSWADGKTSESCDEGHSPKTGKHS